MRPRTLPLALACVGMGSFLAASQGFFVWPVFALCALTTICLQILSNLANDYGDTVNGADSAERQGPTRAVQGGLISLAAMRRAMALFVVLSLGFGIGLIWVAFGQSWQDMLAFLGLGVAAVFAAILYTAGKKPYGYAGLGDLSVLLFFGFVAVMGTYYLYAQELPLALVLPSISLGFFSVGVLNVNNIRDIESDALAGKKSVPVRIGRKAAVAYHGILLFTGLGTAAAYTLLNYQSPWQWLFLITVPLFVKNFVGVKNNQKASQIDPYLKQMALSTLLFVLTFGIGLLV